jgi:hypothetical protein
MNETAADTALEIIDDNNDNPDKGLKSSEALSQKYFNYNNGIVKLTKLQIEKKKKSPVMNINKPLVIIINLFYNF